MPRIFPLCSANEDQLGVVDHMRRDILANSILLLPTAFPSLSNAAEFDTSSEMNYLTRQVRTSIVRGAQIIDKLDGNWERFSDDFGLGENRRQPKKKVLGVGGKAEVEAKEIQAVLDDFFCLDVLNACDMAFLACLPTISKDFLLQQVDQTKTLVRKSFIKKSSLSISLSPEEEFNFNCYSHFRVYNDILVNENISFPAFRQKFESKIRKRLFQLALKQDSSLLISSPPKLTEKVVSGLQITDKIATLLQRKGIISSWERSNPSNDDIEDFISPMSSDSFSTTPDLQFSLALNGDKTLNSQILLQELGYRLYPSFGCWLVCEGLLQCFVGDSETVVNIDDYYFDTAYNSNPDLFEVKQVLLNIVIQRN